MPTHRFAAHQPNPMELIDLAAKYADLKEDHYRLTLALTAALELLTEKGILTEQELRSKAAALDALDTLGAHGTAAQP